MPLHADRLHTLVADWVGTQAIPNTEGLPEWASTPPGAGSVALGADSRAMFVRNQSGNDVQGWKRRTWHTRIFNVRNYGAVGNNIADDRAAIRAAIAAAAAQGGGTVYFPPGEYRLIKGSPSDVRATFLLDGAAYNNIAFLGDGAASKLRMAGSAGFGDMVLFRLCAGVSGLVFENLAMDAAQTTDPDAADQQHFLQFQGRATDTAGASHCRIQRCFFGSQVGDGVRLLGETGARNEFFEILENDFDMVANRACICVQRFSSRVIIADNYTTGSDDNAIDMEPTGGGENAHYTIARNILDHQSKAVAAMTLVGNGASDPFSFSSVCDNIVVRGGPVSWLNVANLVFSRNIIHEVDTANNGAALSGLRRITDVVAVGNVIISESGATARMPLSLTSDAIDHPNRVLFADNILYGSFCGVGARFESCDNLTFNGNLVVVNTDGSAQTGIVQNRSTNNFFENFIAIGNMLLAPAAVTTTLVAAASPFNIGNVNFSQNFSRNPGLSALRLTRSAAEVLTGGYVISENMILGATSSDVDLPNTNIGVTMEGNAGTAAMKLTALALLAGPEGLVSAAAGSLCTNLLGLPGAVTFLKETGSGNTGWKKTTNKVVTATAFTVGNTTGTLFLVLGGCINAPLATAVQMYAPRPVLLRNMRVFQTPGVGAGTNTFTVRVNSVGSALTLAVPFTASGGNVTLNAPLAATQAFLDISVVRSVAPTSAPTNVVIVLECD